MSKKLKFTVNTTYNLQDVGPDYFDGEVEVADDWAKIFVEQGRAVEVVPEPVEDAGDGDGDGVGGENGNGEVEPTEAEPTTEAEAEPTTEAASGLDTASAGAVVTKKKK